LFGDSFLEQTVYVIDESLQRFEPLINLDYPGPVGLVLLRKAFKPLDDEVQMLADKSSPVVVFALPSTLTWSTTTAFPGLGEFIAEYTPGVQDVLIDLGEHVENAELLLHMFPAFDEGLLVQRRAIGDDDLWRKPEGLDFVQKRVHRRLIALTHHLPGYGGIQQRIGCKEYVSSALVHLVDAQDLGEILKAPSAVFL